MKLQRDEYIVMLFCLLNLLDWLCLNQA